MSLKYCRHYVRFSYTKENFSRVHKSLIYGKHDFYNKQLLIKSNFNTENCCINLTQTTQPFVIEFMQLKRFEKMFRLKSFQTISKVCTKIKPTLKYFVVFHSIFIKSNFIKKMSKKLARHFLR